MVEITPYVRCSEKAKLDCKLDNAIHGQSSIANNLPKGESSDFVGIAPPYCTRHRIRSDPFVVVQSPYSCRNDCALFSLFSRVPSHAVVADIYSVPPNLTGPNNPGIFSKVGVETKSIVDTISDNHDTHLDIRAGAPFHLVLATTRCRTAAG